MPDYTQPCVGDVFPLWVCRREHPKYKGLYQYVVANGQMMGHRTTGFGVNCLADLFDNLSFLRNYVADHPGEGWVILSVDLSCTFGEV